MGIAPSSIEIIEENQNLIVKGNFYPVKEQIKEINGYKWNPIRRCWILPNTPINKHKLDNIKRSQIRK